jgi:hypothetical protein
MGYCVSVSLLTAESSLLCLQDSLSASKTYKYPDSLSKEFHLSVILHVFESMQTTIRIVPAAIANTIIANGRRAKLDTYIIERRYVRVPSATTQLVIQRNRAFLVIDLLAITNVDG